MRSLKSWALSLTVISVAVPASAQIQQTGLQLEQSRRVGRTLFEYTYRVEVLNLEAANRVVSGSVSSLSSTTTVVDGSVAFGLVPGFGGATSQDTITIRQDRRYLFEPASLQFAWDAPSAIQLTRETALSVGATLEIQGGSIATQGASGVAYQLELPGGAFAGGAVAITPVTEVAGLVFTPAILGAADLTPDGTRFARAATLRFRPAAGSAFPESVSGFRISAGRVELLPATLAPDGTATILVSGFSTYGLLSGEVVDQLFDSEVVAANRVLDLRLADFREWTKKFFERDVDYFLSRQQEGKGPPYSYPTCDVADFASNEVGMIARMEMILGGDTSRGDAAEAELATLLVGMAEQANVACNDDLWFGCLGAAQRYSNYISDRSIWVSRCELDETISCLTDTDCSEAGVAGRCPQVNEFEASILNVKTCGVAFIEADPVSAVAGIGASESLRFTARDRLNDVVPRDLVLFDVAAGDSVVVNAITKDVPGELEVSSLCTTAGFTRLIAFDEQAIAQGVEISAESILGCSASGLRLSPDRVVVIGNDPASYSVALVDVNGDLVPPPTTLNFSWAGFDPFLGDVGLEVEPLRADRSRAVARYVSGGGWYSPAKVAVCLEEDDSESCFENPSLLTSADFQAVPDLRGEWLGSGSYTATGCEDEDDDGFRVFGNWQVEFTQGLIGGTTVSNFAGLLSGRGIGERILSDLIGTMSETGTLIGIADYESAESGATGQAQFSGVRYLGSRTIELQFTFADTSVDTCRGDGYVYFVGQ